MSHVAVGLTIVIILGMAIALLIVFWLGNRAKMTLDTSKPLSHAVPPFTVAITEANAAVAGTLSQEPIFMKQSIDGLRVQLDNRPLLPLAMFSDPATMTALREIAARITQKQGAEWTALVNVEADGTVTVRRLT